MVEEKPLKLKVPAVNGVVAKSVPPDHNWTERIELAKFPETTVVAKENPVKTACWVPLQLVVQHRPTLNERPTAVVPAETGFVWAVGKARIKFPVLPQPVRVGVAVMVWVGMVPVGVGVGEEVELPVKVGVFVDVAESTGLARTVGGWLGVRVSVTVRTGIFGI